MPIEVAKYQFQPWARRGISAQINEQDTLGNPAAAQPPGERASVPIGVAINAAPQPSKDFALVGPGDIIGIQRDMVVRTEPRHWITNFEPNYLAFLEFYDEDFPWRYTPARPQGERLRPWIFLLVLKPTEFERDDQRLPLPVVKVNDKAGLPPAGESWLFAHVHTEQDIAPGELSNLEKYLLSLREETTADPDKIYSRLLCPRHLEPNQAYQAFLVPTFEVGRLAGLGQPTAGVSAQKPAWDETTTGLELPFYFTWEFSTGEQADFESLVKLLEPCVLDKRIGIRNMDTAHPGFVRADNLGRARLGPDGKELELPPADPATQGLEGALMTDRTEPLPPHFTPNDFQDELQILVNLPETIQGNLAAAPGPDEEFLNDPLVSVPFYGQNHARQHATDKILLDVTRSGWYHDLNRDPRTRVPAGFGTRVIQKGQDKFMQRAWQQVQKVYDANRIIHGFQFTLRYSARYTAQTFSKLDPARLLAITQPVHARVMGSPTTIRQQLLESRLPAPVFSASFRRLVRPAGKLARRFDGAQPFVYTRLVEDVNAGRVTPAPPREVPAGIPSVEDLAGRIGPGSLPAWLLWLVRHRMLALLIALALLLVLGLLSGAWLLCAALALGGLGGFVWLRQQGARLAAAAELTDPARAAAAIQAAPPRPAFQVPLEDESAAEAPAPGGPGGGGVGVPGADSPDAGHFRAAAGELQARLAIRPPEPSPRLAFDLGSASSKIAAAIHPEVAFPLRLSALVHLPDLSLSRPEEIVEAMAHPDFEDPMYTYLRDINEELLIPNLQLIPPNSISLLETNPRFIESYLVGLNHEMARELLWHEYPTDLRGSYFRQFWEVKSVNNPDTPTNAEQRKDITKLHTWRPGDPLGTHRPKPPANADVRPGQKQLVLVIRGELLKRYPNTVVYAQKAVDDGQGNNVIHTDDMKPEDYDRELKFPLFRAEIDPDLRFFGFDLTKEKAIGQEDSNEFPNDRRGWFFVIQEVPGEPRFGMDISYAPTQGAGADPRDTWDNLAWNLFGGAEPAFVSPTPPPDFPRKGNPELTQHAWGRNSAEMAYILFQIPVMVAVHASEMLEKVQ